MSVIFSRPLSLAASAVMSANAVHGLSLEVFGCLGKKPSKNSYNNNIEQLGKKVSGTPGSRGILTTKDGDNLEFKYFDVEPHRAVRFKLLPSKFSKTDRLHFFVAKTNLVAGFQHSEVLLARKTSTGSTDEYEYQPFAFANDNEVHWHEDCPLDGRTWDEKITSRGTSQALRAIMKITESSHLAGDALKLLCGKTRFECSRSVFRAFDVENHDALVRTWSPANPVKYGILLWNCHAYTLAMAKLTNSTALSGEVNDLWTKWGIYNKTMPTDTMLGLPTSVCTRTHPLTSVQWKENQEEASEDDNQEETSEIQRFRKQIADLLQS